MCHTVGFLGRFASVEGRGLGLGVLRGVRSPDLPLCVLSLLAPAGDTDCKEKHKL